MNSAALRVRAAEPRAGTGTALDVVWLGQVRYADALALQQDALEARRRNATPDRLYLLEHPPVVTLGSGARREHLLASEQELEARGIELHCAKRGGDVTFHAPGQLVGYLIVDLARRGARDAHAFLRAVEGALIDALVEVDVSGRRIAGRTGVFVEPGAAGSEIRDRKIASIGIGLRQWVTYHGFALNVDIDLAGFDVIVPCGLSDVEMTSVAREREAAPEELPALARRTRQCVADSFRRAFEHWPKRGGRHRTG